MGFHERHRHDGSGRKNSKMGEAGQETLSKQYNEGIGRNKTTPASQGASNRVTYAAAKTQQKEMRRSSSGDQTK
jgi:hypothetical protein